MLFRTVPTVLEGDERSNRSPLDLVRPTHDRGLRDAWVIDQRALHFHRADPVARNVQYVVHAPEQPEVALVVELGAVAGHVDIGAPLVPVLTDVALRIAVNTAQHGRPRSRERQESATDRYLLASLVPDLGADAWKRPRRRTRTRRRHAGQRRDHDGARLGLPPRVDNGTALSADEP